MTLSLMENSESFSHFASREKKKNKECKLPSLHPVF